MADIDPNAIRTRAVVMKGHPGALSAQAGEDALTLLAEVERLRVILPECAT